MSKELEHAENLVDIGKVEQAISKKHTELLEIVNKSNDEILSWLLELEIEKRRNL